MLRLRYLHQPRDVVRSLENKCASHNVSQAHELASVRAVSLQETMKYMMQWERRAAAYLRYGSIYMLDRATLVHSANGRI